MHRLSITYVKLRNEMAQNRAQLRALVEQVFPEFFAVLVPNTLTALYFLCKYLFPHEFLAMNIQKEARVIEKLSRRQLGLETLKELQRLAKHSIGIKYRGEECLAERLTLDSWIALIETQRGELEEGLKYVIDMLNYLS